MTSLFLRHIAYCTDHDATNFAPFVIAGRTVGWFRRDFLPLLSPLESFSLGETLALLPETPAARTESLKKAAALLSAHHNVPLVGEIYPVIEAWGDAPLAEIDRAAIPWFGTLGFGVHVNGYVRKKDGIYLWIARRAADRRIDAGKLDNMIGGGLPLGFTVEENLVKEGWEEAGLPPALLQTAKAQGRLHYKRDMMKGVRNDVLFVFDLEMPEDAAPKNTDGEVESFTLRPAAEVAKIVAETDNFKFNCNLVMIDFFLRHGVIGPNYPEYAALTEAMKEIKVNA